MNCRRAKPENFALRGLGWLEAIGTAAIRQRSILFPILSAVEGVAYIAPEILRVFFPMAKSSFWGELTIK
jgi:hypothetical protein